MENRKILIEVTEEEYEKIKGGALEKAQEKSNEKPSLSGYTCAELIREINGRIPEYQRKTTTFCDPKSQVVTHYYEGELDVWFDDNGREYESVVTITINETGKSREGGGK